MVEGTREERNPFEERLKVNFCKKRIFFFLKHKKMYCFKDYSRYFSDVSRRCTLAEVSTSLTPYLIGCHQTIAFVNNFITNINSN